MLHDGLPAADTDQLSLDDRRHHDRVPFPAEMTLIWHHDVDTMLRYRILDASDGGFRLRSSTPMLTGMTGMVLRLLPEGRAMDQPVMVAWCRRDGGEYEIGLETF